MTLLTQRRENKWVTSRIIQARIATFIGFMLMGGMLFVWSTGVSSFRIKAGLAGAENDVRFGFLTLALGIGGTIGCFLVGHLLDKWGPKKIVGITSILYPISIIPLGYVTDYYIAGVLIVIYGFLRGAIDTSLNTHGVQVERFYQRPILSAFHAFFSFGGFIIGMISSWIIGFTPKDPAMTFTIIGIAMFFLGLFITSRMLDKDEVLPPEAELSTNKISNAVSESKHFSKTTMILLMIAFGTVLLIGMISEGSVFDWGQEFVHRELNTSISSAGMAVSFFIGAECVGRLIGDRCAEILGEAKVVFLSGIIAITGFLIVSFGGSLLIATGGLILIGLGVSCIAPLMLSNAGRKDPSNAGFNIGIVNAIGYGGMLVGPLSITAIVGYFGLPWLMCFPAALMTLFTILAPMLMRVGKK
ncbi:major Facilitator Superfamily protein [Acinetobacter baumannii 532279]|uniref:MFS transporter n=1 Tax=Acinetobacter baumannii TaxID=470 RepID=UPI000450C595|nr:MFS transporter [Acinetobacter baumannii]EXE88955.1 major Facilitator Superfamily protein [Acinetobacter baumannii 532279]